MVGRSVHEYRLLQGKYVSGISKMSVPFNTEIVFQESNHEFLWRYNFEQVYYSFIYLKLFQKTWNDASF